jgi:hypothetical protein
MKSILCTLALISLSVASSHAGCGKTVTDTGKLKSFDKDSKALVIEVDGKEVKRTLTPTSAGAEDVEKLVGKDVVVVSGHNKVESVKKG